MASDDVDHGFRFEPITTDNDQVLLRSRLTTLLALSLIYLVRPESRPTLDRASFGPSLTTAVQAGQALVELRESGSVSAANRLPWNRENVLRVHLLPPHLTELA